LQNNVAKGNPHNTPRDHAPAGRPTIATIGILLLGSILSHSASAQVSALNAAVKRGVPEDQVVAMDAVLKRPRPAAATAVDRAALDESDTFNSDQGPGPGPIGPGPGCDVFPAPASVGTAVPLSYFGPPPSTKNQSLVGPVQLLDTGD
jgi:hypothetical protein